jgi:hypothetical protein
MKALVVASAITALALVGTARAEPVSLDGGQMDLVTVGNYGGFPPINLSLFKNVGGFRNEAQRVKQSGSGRLCQAPRVAPGAG